MVFSLTSVTADLRPSIEKKQPVPSSLSQFPAPSSLSSLLPSLLPPVPCPHLLPPVPSPPVPCPSSLPQFPVPSSLFQVSCLPPVPCLSFLPSPCPHSLSSLLPPSSLSQVSCLEFAASCVLMVAVVFFPRVRTACGHGAQVIIEGKEKQSDSGEKFFFHECGRRVGMVPRSSLKEGKKGRWWRKERRPQKPTQNQTPKPAGRLHHLVVFPKH